MTFVDTTQLNEGVPIVGSEAPRPFVKWAGGKSRLLAELRVRLPISFGRYFEPFVGGGALFFELRPAQAVIGDINPEIVNVYTVVRDNVEELVTDLGKHRHNRRYFYKLRDADRRGDYWTLSKVEKASRLIYLNKTCFNGLYRVNSRGEFNVPFGDYHDPCFLDAANLRACSAALQSTEIFEGSFELVEEKTAKADFVYFDPPYAPTSKTSSFTSYYQDGFSDDLQLRLSDLCRRLDAKGVYFLLSNSDVPFIRELYQGFTIDSVHSSRPINSKAEKRGPVPELLIRNY